MKLGLKAFFIATGIILLISILGLVVKLVFFPVNVAHKAADTANGVVSKTLNADNALFNYENFKDLYNDARSQVQNINDVDNEISDMKKTYGDPTTWNTQLTDHYENLQQNRSSYLLMYQNHVKEYNADSSKLNRNLFKSRDLPAELPLDYHDFQ